MNQKLFSVLNPALHLVCQSAIKRRVGEQFYAVSLYTSSGYLYLADSLCTSGSDEAYFEACKQVHNTCIAVLINLRDSGLFSDKAVFNLLKGDQCDEERLINAEAVNYPAVVEAFRSDLVIDPATYDELKQRSWS